MKEALQDAAAADRKVRLWLDTAKKVSILHGVIDPAEREKYIKMLDAQWALLLQRIREAALSEFPALPGQRESYIGWITPTDFALPATDYTGNGRDLPYP